MVYVDGSTIDIFVDRRTALTTLAFPTLAESTCITVVKQGGSAQDVAQGRGRRWSSAHTCSCNASTDQDHCLQEQRPRGPCGRHATETLPPTRTI